MTLDPSQPPTPEEIFEGYCLASADHFVGEKGSDSYQIATGLQIEPDQDCCCALGRQTDQGFENGKDAFAT